MLISELAFHYIKKEKNLTTLEDYREDATTSIKLKRLKCNLQNTDFLDTYLLVPKFWKHWRSIGILTSIIQLEFHWLWFHDHALCIFIRNRKRIPLLLRCLWLAETLFSIFLFIATQFNVYNLCLLQNTSTITVYQIYWRIWNTNVLHCNFSWNSFTQSSIH